MISKLRFSLFAVILLVLLGFGFQNQAKGQPGEDDQFCPGVPFTDGWLETDIVGISIGGSPFPNFSAALLGTVESFGGAAVGGLDWQHVDFTDFDNPTPTNEVGSQLVSWWSQKNGRNTFLQVTNVDTGVVFPLIGAPFVPVHVRIYDENCVEVRDFCDTFTVGDTHVYDFGNLISNEGVDIPDGNLQGKEGFVVVTAVTFGCPEEDLAIEYNALAGTMYMLDPNDYLYGINTYARFGVCFDAEFPFIVNEIANGSFQNTDVFGNGLLAPWFIAQGGSAAGGVIDSSGISPNVNPPACNDPLNPDCLDPDADLFMAFAASDINTGSRQQYGESGVFPANLLQTGSLFSNGVDTNVSIVQSNVFSAGINGTPIDNAVLYDLSFLSGIGEDANVGDFTLCNNWGAVCVIDVDNPLAPFFVGCDCYNRTGVGCQAVGSDGLSYNIPPHDFMGGRSGFVFGSIVAPPGNNYVVQFITGQKATRSDNISGCSSLGNTVGVLVDNFEYLEEQIFTDECDGILNGAFNAFLTDVTPDQLAGQFNIQDTLAGADAVMINFADTYFPAYKPVAAFVNADITAWDEFEFPASCGEINVCFVRLGIDESLIISDDFSPVTPTPTPAPPTPTPTPGTPTPTPTPTGGGGGGSSGCAIAASPVQLGTAMANVLIPLIPLAFAFGIGVVRRRRK